MPIERKGNNDEFSFLKAERDILFTADREHGIPGGGETEMRTVNTDVTG